MRFLWLSSVYKLALEYIFGEYLFFKPEKYQINIKQSFVRYTVHIQTKSFTLGLHNTKGKKCLNKFWFNV